MLNSITSTAQGLLPPSPLELAKLAAILKPSACVKDAKAALAAAACLYIEAKVYWDKHADRPAVEFLEQIGGIELLSDLTELLEKADAEKAESEKLRFYPKKATDKVRAKLGVKTARAVKNKLKKHFLSLSDNENEAEAFDEFWEAAKRTDQNETWYAFDVQYLERVLAWSRDIKRIGGHKSLNTLENKDKQ